MMNHIRWAAWGVVDIDNIPSDATTGGNGQARRSYLRKVREELALHGMKLHVGGSKGKPWYGITRGDELVLNATKAGKDAFRKLCEWVLEVTGDTAKQGDTDVGSEDGGVRRAGAEA